ncbi:unnamed protein product [Didymodactylos carnosus]|nr:unnamed protein product [Didymodactylos carnosus]CAF4211835.1 unnamed protein product [Didymodactylos carnosus]
MRDVPVMREKLYRPQFTKQSKSFKLLRSRAEIDKEAAKFVKQRLDVMEHSQDVNNQNTNQGTGRNSSISSSSLQDSDSPVRKLQEMTSTSRHKTSTVWRTVSQSLTTVTDSDIG